MLARHRFFVETAAGTDDAVELDGSVAHQMARVLRLREGEHVVLLDGSGQERVVELVEVSPRRVRGIVRATMASLGEPRLAIALYQALVPRDKLEVVLQKATEVGVAELVPVHCERSLVRGEGGVDDHRLERWRRIVQEAAEQSRRGRVPAVRPPIGLAAALAEAAQACPTLVAWEGERERSIRAALRDLFPDRPPNAEGGPPGPTRVSLFVGPEGGFSPAEIAAAVDLGAVTVSLGPRILRTETAGPILAALVLYEAGELEPTCPHQSVS